MYLKLSLRIFLNKINIIWQVEKKVLEVIFLFVHSMMKKKAIKIKNFMIQLSKINLWFKVYTVEMSWYTNRPYLFFLHIFYILSIGRLSVMIPNNYPFTLILS